MQTPEQQRGSSHPANILHLIPLNKTVKQYHLFSPQHLFPFPH